MDRRARMVTRIASGILMIGALTLLGCSGNSLTGTDVPDPQVVSQETTETSVFYSTGRSLLEERVIVDAEDIYADTLRTLLEAMPAQPDVAVVQPESGFHSVTLEEGVLTIDWQAEVLDFEAEDAEKRLAFGSILSTFGEFPEVEKVRFLVEGQDSGEVNGNDVVAFWGAVSLNGQPFEVIRISDAPSEEETETAVP